MNSGGAYYNTAVELRKQADTARSSYAEALASAHNWAGEYADGLHPAMLIAQAVGLEIAASIYCLAQSIEDTQKGML